MPTPDLHTIVREAGARLHADPGGALASYREAWELGAHDVHTAYAAACAASLNKQIDEAFVWLNRAVDLDAFGPALSAEEDLANIRADARFALAVARARRQAEARARSYGVGADLPRATPEAEGLDRAALERLLHEAGAAGSSAIVVLHDGKVVAESYFSGYNRRIEAMSATKSIVELAIGILLRDRRIPSLDEPLWHFFPEWHQGRKQLVTLRMILNHTSGLAAGRTSDEVYRSPDFVQLALAAELSDDPGSFFFYNNEAVNLLAGIVERVSGQKLDDFARARLFEPLGIRDVGWSRDDAGNPHAMAGLQIYPIDFAKVGQLLVAGGQWGGKRILDESFIEESTRPSQPYDPTCGLLWWIDYDTVRVTVPAAAEMALRARGVPPAIVESLRGFYGKPVSLATWVGAMTAMKLDDYAVLFDALHASKIQVERTATGPYGFSARGYLGQTLAVIPSQRLVAVRMVDASQGELGQKLSADDFDTLVRSLVRR